MATSHFVRIFGRILMGGVIMGPLMVMAEPPPEPQGGFSGQVIQSQPRTETSRLLEEQRYSGAAEESEISAPLYVDSQRRLGETFARPIPESLREETTRR